MLFGEMNKNQEIRSKSITEETHIEYLWYFIHNVCGKNCKIELDSPEN